MAKSDEIEVFTSKEIDLNQILSELGGGVKVVINRKEPRWCDGYLDTLYIDEDDPLSVEDIRDMYGGRKLQVTVHADDGKIMAKRTVKFPDAPRHEGKVIKREDDEKSNDDQNALLRLLLDQQQANSQMMLGFMREQTETVKSMAADRLSDLQKNTTNGNGNGNGSFGEVKKSLELLDSIEEMRERIKGESDTDNPVVSQMLNMAETYFSHMLQAKQQVTAQNPVPPLPESTVRGPDTDRIVSDSDLLSQAAKRFRSMSLEDQQQAAQLFFGQISPSEKVEQDVSLGNEVDEILDPNGDQLRVELDEDDERDFAKAKGGE